MKKGKFFKSVFSAAMAFFCTVNLIACRENISNKDTYIEGQDFQYQYNDTSFGNAIYHKIAKGEADDYFIKIGDFIYKVDGKSGLLTPLCNKPNCLYNKETDYNKCKKCNAFVKISFEADIKYMSGYIYALSDFDDEGKLYRIKADGSEREAVFSYSQDSKDKNSYSINSWLVHRGYFYFIEQKEDESANVLYALKRVDLSKKNKKPETIFEDKSLNLGFLTAYGNHIYFVADPKYDEADVISGVWDAEMNQKYLPVAYQYDITKNKCMKIEINGLKEDEFITNFCFLNDKLIYLPGSISDENMSIYSANLDGSSQKIILDDVPAESWIFTDGKYLYVSDGCEFEHDAIMSGKKPENINVTITVYDGSMKKIDTMVIPVHNQIINPNFGPDDKVFLLADTDPSSDETYHDYEVLEFDKSNIGTINGAEMPVKDLRTLSAKPPYGDFYYDDGE